MGFEELNLKYKYRSDEDSLQSDFYNKVLRKAVRYDRAVGYFTSNSIAVLADGLIDFINRDGEIRVVCNPYLSIEDFEAIRKGYQSKKDIITSSIISQLRLTSDLFSEEPVNVLSWLIYTGKLDMKIAYTEKAAIYHEKFGIFHDKEGKAIAFSGSSNETMGGIISNFEKIDVYHRDFEEVRIQDAIHDFELLWNNKTTGLVVEDFPDDARNYILSKRSLDKPKKTKRIVARKYQEEAIEAFKLNNWKGIFDMGTGTGKTLTSIFCAREYLTEHKEMFLVILVPLTHLVDQWVENLELMGHNSVLKCFGSKESWIGPLEKRIRNYNIGLRKTDCVVAVYNTATMKPFQDLIEKVKGNAFLIADECHNFGVPGMRNHKFENISARLGLSATPDRWWDEEGTNDIYSYFGEIIFKYGIKEAIEGGSLVPYKYNPILVDLQESEFALYKKYSTKIFYMLSQDNSDKEELQLLLIKRSQILSKAASKKVVLCKMLDEFNRAEVSHALVYCGPGEVNEITKKIFELGYRVHRFDSKVKNEDRADILRAFEAGEIQILVAIKCLDEGVDIPSIRSAYFLASTSNPREFIQRRGRVLRKAPGKIEAQIFDFIILPVSEDPDTDKSIIAKEMPRFAEFSNNAINKYTARNEVKRILEIHELDHLMDKLPWEVYYEMKENLGGKNGY